MDSLLPVILVIQNAFIWTKYVINSLIHGHFHIGLVIIPRRILALGSVSGQYGGLGMITRPIWKCPCINLYLFVPNIYMYMDWNDLGRIDTCVIGVALSIQWLTYLILMIILEFSGNRRYKTSSLFQNRLLGEWRESVSNTWMSYGILWMYISLARANILVWGPIVFMVKINKYHE